MKTLTLGNPADFDADEYGEDTVDRTVYVHEGPNVAAHTFSTRADALAADALVRFCRNRLEELARRGVCPLTARAEALRGTPERGASSTASGVSLTNTIPCGEGPPCARTRSTASANGSS